MGPKTKTDIFEAYDQAVRRIAALEAGVDAAIAKGVREGIGYWRELDEPERTVEFLIRDITHCIRAALAPAPAPEGEPQPSIWSGQRTLAEAERLRGKKP